MPLHLPRLFGRSPSQTTGVRTDLCTTYPYTDSERREQGYLYRSDYDNAVTFLMSILKNITEERERGSKGWADWSVDAEMRDVCRFHFEDLDQWDQMCCPMVYLYIRNYAGMLEPYNESTLGPLNKTLEHLRSFKEQAEQLYGKESCKAVSDQVRKPDDPPRTTNASTV